MEAPSDDEFRARQLLEIERTQEALHAMRRGVRLCSNNDREGQVPIHNKRTKVRVANFVIGDFVLVRRAADKGHKLQFKWLVPGIIVAVKAELVYEVVNIFTVKLEVVHARRLQNYRSVMDGKTV